MPAIRPRLPIALPIALLLAAALLLALRGIFPGHCAAAPAACGDGALLAASPSAAPPAGPAAQPPPAMPRLHRPMANRNRNIPTSPRRRPDGAKWRIAYVASGEHYNYQRILRVIVDGLQALGWLSVPPIPDGLSDRETWEFLASNTHSDVLEFVADAWWSPGNFDNSRRPAMRQAIAERLNERHDIDLIVAMGTLAGQDMVALGAPVPTIVASTSDAVAAHIVKSAKDSGLDNLFVHIYPERYARQLRLFYDTVPFKTLGLVYENTQEGRIFSAVDAIERLAGELGFTLVHCDARAQGLDADTAVRNVVACYRETSAQVDAVYVSTHIGITPLTIGRVAQVLREAKVPSFSMHGSEDVRHGILMSLAQSDHTALGLFFAETIARIFNGAQPRQLKQIWRDPATIALNLETARVIGFDPPVDVLLAADEVYEAR
ncbi:ABC transporter substrate-binding protein [Bordetella genomosp. 10]|nr:ABC transporter substrate binding protein [Bordetella genomosp. 10]